MAILLEASKSKYIKKYPCQWCGKHYDREALIRHIEKYHPDEIPEGYSATRVVFNQINKKDHGNCVICRKPTPWNPTLARYDRFCSEDCKNKYMATAKARMINKYGKDNLINEPEQQKKMLANRKISGVYKFSTGGELGYTGSYEKKCLEFLDKVMEYKVGDVETPGPVVEYDYGGKKHFWITDIYIPSYQLAIDCKDGGENKNMREMKEYREKQIAKEKAIADQGVYNYLRLTDNNFAQLMAILAELKMQLMDNNPEKIIRINENMFPGIGAMMPMGDWKSEKGDVYITNYLMNNIFDGIAVSDTPTFEHTFIQSRDGIISEISREDLFSNDSIQYNVYKYHCEDTHIFTALEQYAESKEKLEFSMLEIIFNEYMYSPDEWKAYESVTEITDYFDYMNQCENIAEASLRDAIFDNQSFISLSKDYNNSTKLQIKEDINGYYLENAITGMRTISHPDKNFSKTEMMIVDGGIF